MKLFNKKRMGRPPIPKHQRKTYQRMAVKPETYKRIVINSKKSNEKIIDYVDRIVD